MSEIYRPAEDSYLLSQTLQKIIPKLLNKNKNQNLKFLEIGCGSGIQLETALKSGIGINNILGADINNNAVKHCKNLGFNVILSNLFSNIKGKFDIIVFNPPYLPEHKFDAEKDTTGGKKGGETINRFLKQAKLYLKKNGIILLLISSLTEGVDFSDYKIKNLAEKNLFFEKLYVKELSL